ncbi:unnamed protein product [Durusdinium trenchii]|uniref:Uncharacterized protein n=1 Tax=Durusdinium trenchii TaxID=1381693 RepID=A0ABP0NCG5_9DINO
MGKSGTLDTFQVYYQCRLAELQESAPQRATTPQDCFKRRNRVLEPLRPSSEADILHSDPLARTREGGSRSFGTLQSKVRRSKNSQSQTGLSRQQIASNESLKLAWTKDPGGRASVGHTTSPTSRNAGREHCIREGPRRSSLEKKPAVEEDQVPPTDEAPTEEQERALALLQRSNFFKNLEPAVLSELPRLATFIGGTEGCSCFPARR